MSQVCGTPAYSQRCVDKVMHQPLSVVPGIWPEIGKSSFGDWSKKRSLFPERLLRHEP